VRESFSQHVNIAYQRAVLRKGDPAVPLASSVSELRTDPGTDVEADPEEQESELNAPLGVPSAQAESPGPRRKPMFRR
jgi:hypothetical protein